MIQCSATTPCEVRSPRTVACAVQRTLYRLCASDPEITPEEDLTDWSSGTILNSRVVAILYRYDCTYLDETCIKPHVAKGLFYPTSKRVKSSVRSCTLEHPH